MFQNLTAFSYNGKTVRTIEQGGVIWWVLVDVCKILGLTSSARTAERLDKDEVSQTQVIDALGRKQLTAIINEPGLYAVLLRSDKPEAKLFKRWVTHEVLPSIRTTGQYLAPQKCDTTALQKELVYNTPRNATAQEKIAEIRQGTAALLKTLELYNCFLPTQKAQAYQKTMTDYGQSIASAVSALAHLPIETVVSDW